MRLIRCAAAALLTVFAACAGDPSATAPTNRTERVPGTPGTTIDDPGTDAPPETIAADEPNTVGSAVVGARAAHTATTLSDGRVLVAGGCVTDGCVDATVETFVVSDDGRSAVVGPTLATGRDAHTATLLADGRVVLVGGYPGEGGGVLASVDIVDVELDTSREIGMLAQARGGHAAARTSTGSVIVVGGWIGPGTYTASAELFDPVSGRSIAVPDAPYAADALDAVVLLDGRVLITGGQITRGTATRAAALFDPATSTWEITGEMDVPRLKHFTVVLPDGRVLVMGGTSDDEQLLRSTEIFDPVTGSFTPGPQMAEARYEFPGGAVVLDDGRVAIGGGGRTVEVVDVNASTSSIVKASARRGSFATVNMLGTGDLLVVGGYDERIRLRNEMFVIPASEL